MAEHRLGAREAPRCRFQNRRRPSHGRPFAPLTEELGTHKAKATYAESDDLVFATRNRTKRNRSNVTRQILQPAIVRANKKLAEAELPTIQSDVTNHSLRRTFASLLYEAGASPAYVMSQMGHESSALALEVYAKVMQRKRETGARMDELVRGADWAQMGTNGDDPTIPLTASETENPAEAGLA
jgi:integrase